MSCDLLFKMLLKGVLCMCECMYIDMSNCLNIRINWETCVSTCVCVLCVYEHIVGGRVYSSRTGLDFTNFLKKWLYLFKLVWSPECENLAFYHCISSLLKHLVGTELVSTHWICCYSVAKSCPTPCGPVDCSPPGSSVHEDFQAKILQWVAFSFSGVIFPTQELNLPLLHWQLDSSPPSHQGSLFGEWKEGFHVGNWMTAMLSNYCFIKAILG